MATGNGLRAGFALVLTAGRVGVVAGGKSHRLSRNIFSNKDGESPCLIADLLLQPCVNLSNVTKVVPIDESASPCTCNTVLFNLWSACVYQLQGLPSSTFNIWVTQCTQNNVTVDWMQYPYSNTTGELAIPDWAFLNVTAQYQLNISSIIPSKHSLKWTTLQIVLPIIVVFPFICLSVGLFLFYRRRRTQTRHMYRQDRRRGSSRYFTGIFTRVDKVRPIARSASWSLDTLDTLESAGPSPARPRDRTGHVRIPSGSSLPGELSWSSKIWESIWRNPFKRRPIHVVSQPPRKGFRIDDVDVATRSSGSRRSRLTAADVVALDLNPNENEAFIAKPDRNSLEEERPPERDPSVLLISRTPGVDFSMTSETASSRGPLGGQSSVRSMSMGTMMTESMQHTFSSTIASSQALPRII